ncbi:MAG TPA: twin-arginine translocation signal domain-containing protein [Acidobacteriaceae bacterium]|jgi:hypothetical protein|nr:twin-arginine translocation signal domain-containing protein [Acidobacteriaceae bacterium]
MNRRQFMKRLAFAAATLAAPAVISPEILLVHKGQLIVPMPPASAAIVSILQSDS